MPNSVSLPFCIAYRIFLSSVTLFRITGLPYFQIICWELCTWRVCQEILPYTKSKLLLQRSQKLATRSILSYINPAEILHCVSVFRNRVIVGFRSKPLCDMRSLSSCLVNFYEFVSSNTSWKLERGDVKNCCLRTPLYNSIFYLRQTIYLYVVHLLA